MFPCGGMLRWLVTVCVLSYTLSEPSHYDVMRNGLTGSWDYGELENRKVQRRDRKLTNHDHVALRLGHPPLDTEILSRLSFRDKPSPHRHRRQAEGDRTSVKVTCDLFLRSDQLLWRYVKSTHPKFRQSDEEIELQIQEMFKRHVDDLNDIFATQFNTYDHSLSYDGINFTISKTQILRQCSSTKYSFCDSSLNSLKLLENMAEYSSDEHCLMFLFTYRDPRLVGGGLANLNGACGRKHNYGYLNLGWSTERLHTITLAHEIGHCFGALHDVTQTCKSTDKDIPGNTGHLMLELTVGIGQEVDKHKIMFSSCSKDNISRFLDDVINERRNFSNCFTVHKRILAPPVEVPVPTSEDRIRVWVVGAACLAIILGVCMSVLIPVVLWKKRVTFIMKLVYRFQMYEDNDEKEFDAFISYRSTEVDERFVVHTLFPKLEKEMGFKICVHFRDFMPGETIANNIIWAIENSRRTILVLSPEYVTSEFCQFEYQRAQHEMLKQKQRIIPIMLEDITAAGEYMDNTMKTILNSITYIVWPGAKEQKKVDKFWEMIKLSMPKLSRNVTR